MNSRASTIEKLHGVFPALPTPLDDSEHVDFESLGTLVDRLLEAGICGLTVLGSSSEATYLSTEERARIFEFVKQRVGRRATLLAGVIAFGTEPAVEEGRRLIELGADALMVALPQYYPTPFARIVEHYRRVREEVGAPVVYYHYPDPTHLRLSPSEIGKLFAEVDLCGIKNSSLDTSDTLAQLKAVGRPIRMFTGSSFDFLPCLKGGANGSICPVAVLMPKSALALYERFSAGDEATAQELQNRFFQSLPIVMPEPAESGPPIGVAHAGVKEALRVHGVIRCARVRSPQPLPSAARRAQIRALVGLLEI